MLKCQKQLTKNQLKTQWKLFLDGFLHFLGEFDDVSMIWSESVFDLFELDHQIVDFVCGIGLAKFPAEHQLTLTQFPLSSRVDFVQVDLKWQQWHFFSMLV